VACGVVLKLAFLSKNQIVYQTLLESIIQEGYKPGEKLVIDELAASMSISQIPIREALRQLEADGFVSFEPHIGFTVTSVHAELVAEVFTLLEATEVFSSRKACQTMTTDQLNKLELMIRSMDATVENPAQWSQDNKCLHLFVGECANTPLITSVMKKALDHWDRLRRHYFTDVLAHRIKVAQRDHWQILAAFRDRNPDNIGKLIREHNQNALAAYMQHLQDEPRRTQPGEGQC
jgi:DNA-binding GntR family transcriptional regulator